MKLRPGYIVIALLLLGSGSYCQSRKVTKGAQQWVHYFNQTRLSENWVLFVDGGYRWKNAFIDRHQYLVRAAAAYLIRPGINVAAGIGHWGTYSDIGIATVEIRPHQQVTMRTGTNIILSQRVRIEERFREATTRNDQQFQQFNWRFRYYINVSIPIVREFGSHNQMSLRFNIGDEILINAGKKIVYNVFDQNRVLIGPIFRLKEHFSFIFRYSGTFAALNLPAEYVYNHIWWLGIQHRMNWPNRSKQ